MKKHLIYYRVDEICSEDISKENKADNLLCFWGELRGPLDKEYFINRVFRKLSYFPKEIKENEELLKEADERNYLHEINDSSHRKNKPIQ